MDRSIRVALDCYGLGHDLILIDPGRRAALLRALDRLEPELNPRGPLQRFPIALAGGSACGASTVGRCRSQRLW
jgi:hypothetical protein